MDNQSEFQLLDDGMDAFIARMFVIEQAKETLDLKSFIFKEDPVGRVILSKLQKAAERGVSVRLLIDDLWSGSKDQLLLAYDAHPNIEIKLFNPLSRRIFWVFQYLFRFGSITRRMHNKALIADDRLAVSGGRNIALEYFGLDDNTNFCDLDILTKGPIVKNLSGSFNDFWSHSLSVPISQLKRKLNSAEAKTVREHNRAYVASISDHKDVHEYAEAALETATNDERNYVRGDGYLISDSPDKVIQNRKRVDLHLSDKMEQLFKSARKEVIVVTPYFIPGKLGLEGFTQLVRKGIRVVVITNSLSSNNHNIVHAHYANYRKKMLQAGVEIYELCSHNTKVEKLLKEETLRDRVRRRILNKKQVLHAKTYVFDRNKLFIGSLNLDPRSWVENTELGMIIKSSSLGNEFGKWVDKEVKKSAYRLSFNSATNNIIWEQADGSRLVSEPDATVWKKLKLKVFSKLPIESWL
ncbi:phospholipase D family protein [Marinicella sp. W31]|uniref:phospholipase D family protein n=1 Tax=Marinicella sp. W31 TaxID=3023713 RepID=UPI003757FA60